MQTRYFVLRDGALYMYHSKNQKVPSRITCLRGLYISNIELDENNINGFQISHENKSIQNKYLYHKNKEVI